MTTRERIRFVEPEEVQEPSSNTEYNNPSIEDPGYPLNAREEEYCRQYIIDFNQTQSAIRSGYAERSARQTASRLMRKANIQSFIARLRDDRNEIVGLTTEWVIERLMRIADANMGDYSRWNNRSITYVDSETLTSDQKYAVHTVTESIGKGGERKSSIKLESKATALEKLARHLGMFEISKEIDDPLDFIKKYRDAVDFSNTVSEGVPDET